MNHEADRIPRGLPDRLPDGERLIWQGGPHWWNVAKNALHVRKIGAYFAILMLWSACETAYDGGGAAQIALALGGLLPVALLALALLTCLAMLIARTTVYTLTDRRVVMLIGIALPITINIPLHSVEAVSVARAPDGSGDIALGLPEGDRIAYLHLWPHARAWEVARPQPMFRGLADVGRVSDLLAIALRDQNSTAYGHAPALHSEDALLAPNNGALPA